MRRRGPLSLVCIALVATAAWLSAPAQAAVPPQLFGVTTVNYPTPAQFDRMARAGIKVCRLPFNWYSAEPFPGARNYFITDTVVADATRAGITLLPNVGGSAAWATGNPSRPPLNQLAAWQQMLQDWAARYGTNGTFWALHPELPVRPVTNWEIWNEPNLVGFWAGKPDAGDFASLVKASAAGLRAGDPAAQVITGGVFPRHTIPNTVAMTKYLNAFYAVPGIKDAFDGLAVHPYGTKPAEVVHWIGVARRLMRAHGDGSTPIWATEFGWSTGGKRWRFSPYKATIRQQARNVARTYALLKRKAAGLGLVNADWFSFTDLDAPGPDFWIHHEGLFFGNGKPKPSWFAYVRAAGGTP